MKVKGCGECIYIGRIGNGEKYCDYIGATGKARILICKPGKYCTVKQEAPKREHWDEAEALRLFLEGKTDREIGQAVGVSAATITNWRHRRGHIKARAGRNLTA